MDGSPEAEIASSRRGPLTVLTELLAPVRIFLVVLFKIYMEYSVLPRFLSNLGATCLIRYKYSAPY